jgi:hypothetical protein
LDLAAVNIVTSKSVDKKGVVAYIADDPSADLGLVNRQAAKSAKEKDQTIG